MKRLLRPSSEILATFDQVPMCYALLTSKKRFAQLLHTQKTKGNNEMHWNNGCARILYPVNRLQLSGDLDR